MDVLATARAAAARWGDRALVLLLAGTALWEIWIGPLVDDGWTAPRPAATAAALLVSVPLLWRRAHPNVVLAAVMTGAFAEIALGSSLQGPVQAWVAFLVVVYAVASHSDLRPALLGLAAALGFVLVIVAATPAPRDEILGEWVAIAAVWALARWLRTRNLLTAELRARAARLEREREEQARLAASEERTRISRELHDVVAHSVSVMVVQAQAADRLLDRGGEAPAREALGAIESTGREALVELRRMLGVLRRTDDGTALAPQPGLDRLDALVRQMRDAGLPVELVVEGHRGPLPAAVDISAYRIVQEALTNTLRHAGPAHARVAVRYGAGEVDVEVVDDGRGDGASKGAGQGLVGIRERATLHGGTAESGRRPEGGFRVHVRLPAARPS